MRVSRFVSNVAPERQRFASPLQALGFGLAAALALTAVFPAHSLEHRLASSEKVDAVSMAYLGAWLHAKPDDFPLRLVLARHDIEAGDFGGGERTLAPIFVAADSGPEVRTDAELLMLDIRQRQLWSMGRDNPGYAQARTLYLIQLHRLAADPAEQGHWREFADIGFAMGDTDFGRELYLRLIHADPLGNAGLVERLVQMDMAQGNYRRAAASYFNMLPYTTDIESRRQYFLAGLHVLRSGNLLNEAISASQSYIGPLAYDSETLVYMVNLALADGRTDVAATLAARLLRQHMSPGKSV